MDHVTATAIRRGGLAFLGPLSALVAHSAASGRLIASLLTPFVVMSMGGAVAMGGLVAGRAQHAGYREWSARGTVFALVTVQLGAHVALWGAPWLYGLGGHAHRAPLLAPLTLACHLLAAAILALVLIFGQRILARLVTALVALLAPRRSAAGRPARSARPVRLFLPARPGAPCLTRGPPHAVIAPTAVAATGG